MTLFRTQFLGHFASLTLPTLHISVALVFLSRTQISRIENNVWQSVTQATFSSGDAQDVLRSSTPRRDSAVKKEIRDARSGKNVVQLGLIQIRPAGSC